MATSPSGWRTTSPSGHIPGGPWAASKVKRGVPSIKSNDQKFRIDATVASTRAETGAGAVRHGLKILMGVNDVRHELDEANRTVKLTLDRPAYVPMGVFKCLVKMAIAIMPPEEEQKCAHLKKWILLANPKPCTLICIY
ncbi:MAG: hypothetical protein WBF95_13725 [Comamonas thiooxydans]